MSSGAATSGSSHAKSGAAPWYWMLMIASVVSAWWSMPKMICSPVCTTGVLLQKKPPQA